MKSLNVVLSRFTVFALAISLLAGQTMFAFAANVSAGELTVTGSAIAGEKPFVLVNGDRAFSGRSFFSDGTIITTENSSASINLGKVGRIEVAPNSMLSLSFTGDSITGTLSSGNVNVANGDGVTVKITTPDDVVTNEAAAASSFSVTIGANASSVSATSGTVRFNNGASIASRQDDDDDDDDGAIWIPIIVIGGAIGAVVLWKALEDDDEIVSPIR